MLPLRRNVTDDVVGAAMRFVLDDEGQDLVEYGLLSGIVGVLGILLFPVIADKMATAYGNWQGAAQAAWEPCAPAPASCP